ncbi:hypothetical protein OIU77_011229 [Salix suchowensis]|uniref:Tetratricopeptide repeat protein n=1 Tax=Salix suchowensis TaxID=1278906 RepID=A0ABQ9AD04_9ROSI|nr:hypothetical protein OIU77_011229 [Salix suchowensis]
MERRLGNLEDAFSLYEQAIAIEKGKELPLVLPALYAQYARFIYLTSKNLLKARKVLVEALENAQFSKLLLEALIHLEIFLPQPKQIDYLDSLVDNFILTSSDSVNTASAAERAELSCIFLEMVNVSFIHFEIYLLIQEFNQILAYSYLIVNSYMTLCWHEFFFSPFISGLLC